MYSRMHWFLLYALTHMVALVSPFVQESSYMVRKHGIEMQRRQDLRWSASAGNDEETNDAEEAERIAKFKARLMSGGLDEIASVRTGGEEEEENTEWAKIAKQVKRGVVLMGESSFFFGGKDRDLRNKACERVGLQPDLESLVPKERLNSFLPVILVLDMSDSSVSGLVLGRRSGYLMGDFKNIDTSGFLTQPLFVGGPSAPEKLEMCTVGAESSDSPTGILAVHPYESISGAEKLTSDGLYLGGDWNTVKLLVERGMANPFRFRLFAQGTSWSKADFDSELKHGAWRLADVSTDLILKDRPRGADIWADIDSALSHSS